MLDQFHPCIHDSTENIADVKDDNNCVEAMTSKIILMMPKNQELSKFQSIRGQKASRIKFQRIKIQE